MSELIGRNEEWHHLLQAYERTKQSGAKPPRPSREFVLIRGNAGTGKTTLVSSLQPRVTANSGCYLVGKFDLTARQVPYAAFVSLFNQLTDQLLGSGETLQPDDLRISFVRRAVQLAVGSEGRLLSDMFPSLERLMVPQLDPAEAQGGETGMARFHFVFCKLCQAISAIVPLVFFFDDLQWSDPASLDLIHTLLQSPLQGASYSNSSLLIVGAYRDEGMGNESPESKAGYLVGSAVINAAFSSQELDSSQHSTAGELPELPLSSRLRSWKNLASNGSLSLTEISLKNLDESSMNDLLGRLLDLSPDSTTGLAMTLFSKSHGNPFSAVQLLRHLINQGVIRKKEESGPWTWDDDSILKATSRNEIDDELVLKKLETLPRLSRDVLKMVALIGDEVDMSAITTYFDEAEISNIELALQAATRDSHLTFDRQQYRYKFANKRMRHNVLATVDDSDEMSFKIGYKLWTQSTPEFLSAKLNKVVTLLNHGIGKLVDQAERYKVANLNLEAGVKAMSLASFQEASQYFRAGIEFLEGSDNWKEEYKLSISLYSAAADAEVCNQDFDRVLALTTKVFQHASSIEDRLAAHVARIIATGQHGSVRTATEEGLSVLRELGENLAQKKSSYLLQSEVMKAKASLRWKSNETLLMLPPMQNKQKIAAMHLMSMLLPYAYQAIPGYVAVIGTELVRSCIRYGIHKDSAVGFVAFGLVISRTNRSEGYRLGNLALSMVERLRARELFPRIHLYFYGMIHHWTQPLKQSLAFLEKAENIGMEVGDVEYAIFALNFRCSHALFAGTSLSQLEGLIIDAIRKMQQFKQRNILSLNMPLLQYIHNLTGRAPDPKVLSGDIVHLYDPDERVDSVFIPYAHHFFGADLAFMFGDHEFAEQMLERRRGLKFEPVACYIATLDCLKESLISIARARYGIDRRKNTRIARRKLKQMKKWALDSKHNFLNKQRLMEAELQTLTPHRHIQRRILALYDEAIECALQEGFIHEAALASELTGNYLKSLGERIQAMSYWEKACGFYQGWGATEKATQLSMRMRHFSQT